MADRTLDAVPGTVWRPAARGWQRRIGRAVTRRGLWPAGTVVAAAVLAVVVVPLLVPLDPTDVALDRVLQPPTPAHPFGTDGLGRDILLRCVYGMRVSFAVALLSAVTATVLGTAAGAVAGAAGGWVDRLLMRLVDAAGSVPHLVWVCSSSPCSSPASAPWSRRSA